MKHFYALLCYLLIAASAVATTPNKIHKDDLRSRHIHSTTKVAGTFSGEAKTQTTSAKAAKAEAEAEWDYVGECPYVEDIATCLFYAADPVMYNVDVYQDKANPGIYRIVNPWKNYPYVEGCTKEGGIFDQTDDSYIEIDATDPDCVIINVSPLGLGDDEQATTYICSDLAIYDQIDETEEYAKSVAGKLADNVISFPQAESLCLIYGTKVYAANIYGKFYLVLPGGETPIDYTIGFDTAEAFCPDDNGNYNITVTGDDRIPGIYYALYDDLEELSEADLTTLTTEGKSANINQSFAVNLSGQTASKVYILMVPVDELDQVQEDYAAYATLYNPLNNSSDWEVLGQADMTEGLISGLFNNVEPETYEVTVEQSKSTPGLLRIVNPYANWSYADYYLVDHKHNHYIYIDASDPDLVIFQDSPIGLSLADFGEVVVTSYLWEDVQEWGDWILDYLDWFEFGAGTLVDNVITFPYNTYMLMRFSNYNSENWYYTNLNSNPAYDGSDDTVAKYIDGDFKLDLTKAFNGVNTITVDPNVGNATYYNLQGIRVDNPSNGIYIRKSNNSIMKVFVK